MTTLSAEHATHPAQPLSDRAPHTAAPWHPLRVEGTALPANLLLLAKLTALFLLGLDYVGEIDRPFLPLLGFPVVPESWAAGVQLALRGTLVAAALALVLNRRARLNCSLIAAVLFASMLLTRHSFANAKAYAALVLLIIALYDGPRTYALLRWQLVVMYAGAALNKLLDPDWQSGVFFDHWMGSVLDKGWYHSLAAALPARDGASWLALALSWGTIVTELVLVACFAWRRLLWVGVALAVGFHTASVAAAGTYFGVYFPALAATMLALAAWPQPGTVALPRGPAWARWIRSMDLDRRFADTPATDYVTLRDRVHPGPRGVALALLTLPMTWWLVFAAVYAVRCAKVGLLGSG